MNEKNFDHIRAMLKALKVSAVFHPSVEFISALGTILVAGFGGWMAWRHRLRVSDIVAFLLYLSLFYAPVTGLATLEMTALFVLLTPHQELTPRTPVPVAPALVTAAPQGETLNALSNIEQLLYEQKLAKVLDAGGTARDLLTEEEKLEAQNAQNEATYEEVVYSVFSNAVYYHATKVCRTQTNGRELTVRDALREGLQPCPYCNPPAIVA